jgi:hypothetical protein
MEPWAQVTFSIVALSLETCWDVEVVRALEFLTLSFVSTLVAVMGIITARIRIPMSESFGV